MFPGGFSAGDEPEGSGKFIATLFRNPALTEALESLLYQRDGLASASATASRLSLSWASCPTATYSP